MIRLIKDGKVISERGGMSMDARVMGNGVPSVGRSRSKAKDDYYSETTPEMREADEVIGRNNTSGTGTAQSIVKKGSGHIKPVESNERLLELESGLTQMVKKLKLIVRAAESKQAARSMDSFIDGSQKPVKLSGIDAYMNGAAQTPRYHGPMDAHVRGKGVKPKSFDELNSKPCDPLKFSELMESGIESQMAEYLTSDR